MKLTGELKKKVDSAETMDEKRSIIANVGMELTDDELEGVAGGYATRFDPPLTSQKPKA